MKIIRYFLEDFSGEKREVGKFEYYCNKFVYIGVILVISFMLTYIIFRIIS